MMNHAKLFALHYQTDISPSQMALLFCCESFSGELH